MTTKEIEEFLLGLGTFKFHQGQYIYNATLAGDNHHFSIVGVYPADISGHNYGLYSAEALADWLQNKHSGEKINGMTIEEYYDSVINSADCSIDVFDVL